MAFTPEDGTGLAGANAYINVAFADAYFLDRGNATWAAATTQQKQEAIVRATDYIETRFGPRFLGIREFPDTPQALSFPRLKIYDREGYALTGVPVQLQKATAEYALRALSASLFLEPTVDPSGALVTGKRQKVGPIETETTFVDGGSVSTIKAFPAADKLIEGLIAAGGGVIRA